MSFSGQTAYQTWLTPEDQDVLDNLVKLITGATSAVRFSVYGCTLKPFFDAVVQMDQAGLDCSGLFDHSQAAGPSEHQAVLDFYTKVKKPSKYLIGTSPKSHQILHLKGVWVNCTESLNKPDPQQFDTWEQALSGGYPVVWSGSWNFSASATSQFNNADVMPGIDRASAFERAFTQIFDWVKTNEAQYQVAAAA